MKRCHCNRLSGALPSILILIGLLHLTVLTDPASAAPVAWNLTGVTFADGGGVTGYFIYDPTPPNLGMVPSAEFVAVDIQVTSPSLPGLTAADPFAWGPGYSRDVSRAEWHNGALFFTDDPTGWPYGIGLSITVPSFDPMGTGPFPIVQTVVQEQIIPGSRLALLLGTSGYFSDSGTGGQLTTSLPEPSILLLLGSGLAGLWVGGRKNLRCLQSVGSR